MDLHIFISYRRPEQGQAEIAVSLIGDRFRKDGVSTYVDKTNLGSGSKFGDDLVNAIRQAVAMVVFIGPEWTNRLHQENDWVAREIREALRAQVTIFPVLVNNAKLPTNDEIPAELRGFLRYQATDIRPFRMDHDFALVLNGLGREVQARLEREAQLEKERQDEARRRADEQRRQETVSGLEQDLDSALLEKDWDLVAPLVVDLQNLESGQSQVALTAHEKYKDAVKSTSDNKDRFDVMARRRHVQGMTRIADDIERTYPKQLDLPELREKIAFVKRSNKLAAKWSVVAVACLVVIAGYLMLDNFATIGKETTEVSPTTSATSRPAPPTITSTSISSEVESIQELNGLFKDVRFLELNSKPSIDPALVEKAVSILSEQTASEIYLLGHADSSLSPNNNQLSFDRANYVAKLIEGAATSMDKVIGSIEPIGCGTTSPVTTPEGNENRELSRRVEWSLSDPADCTTRE